MARCRALRLLEKTPPSFVELLDGNPPAGFELWKRLWLPRVLAAIGSAIRSSTEPNSCTSVRRASTSLLIPTQIIGPDKGFEALQARQIVVTTRLTGRREGKLVEEKTEEVLYPLYSAQLLDVTRILSERLRTTPMLDRDEEFGNYNYPSFESIVVGKRSPDRLLRAVEETGRAHRQHAWPWLQAVLAVWDAHGFSQWHLASSVVSQMLPRDGLRMTASLPLNRYCAPFARRFPVPLICACVCGRIISDGLTVHSNYHCVKCGIVRCFRCVNTCKECSTLLCDLCDSSSPQDPVFVSQDGQLCRACATGYPSWKSIPGLVAGGCSKWYMNPAIRDSYHATPPAAIHFHRSIAARARPAWRFPECTHVDLTAQDSKESKSEGGPASAASPPHPRRSSGSHGRYKESTCNHGVPSATSAAHPHPLSGARGRSDGDMSDVIGGEINECTISTPEASGFRRIPVSLGDDETATSAAVSSASRPLTSIRGNATAAGDGVVCIDLDDTDDESVSRTAASRAPQSPKPRFVRLDD